MNCKYIDYWSLYMTTITWSTDRH